MNDFGSQVVEEEGLADLVSLLSGDRHGFELIKRSNFEVHGGPAFDVAELEVSRGETGVRVEKAPELVLELGELLGVDFSVVLALVVKNVDGLLVEILGHFRNLIYHVA